MRKRNLPLRKMGGRGLYDRVASDSRGENLMTGHFNLILSRMCQMEIDFSNC